MMNKMQKMRGHKKGMHPLEQKAKMGVVSDMQKMAEDAMGHKLNGLKKVTVASDSPEGLQHGLDKAQDMVGNEHEDMYAEGGMVETHPTEALHEADSDVLGQLADAFDDSHPDHENFAHTEEDEDGEDGMSAYPDADGDHQLEADQAEEHAEDERHETQPTETHDELDRQIEELMAKKKKLGRP